MYKKLHPILISMLFLLSTYSIQSMGFSAVDGDSDEESIITLNDERIPLTTKRTNNTGCCAREHCAWFNARNLYATLASTLLVISVIEFMTYGHSSSMAYNVYLGARGILASIALIKDARERYIE